MKNQNTTLKTFRLLLPFLWPKNRSDLKIRVIFALFCLILAKIANVYTPLILGKTVDSLSEVVNNTNLLILIPVSLIVAYGIARIITFAFSEIRDALFSKVSQHAMRQVTLTVFKHLHTLSLRFHLDKHTGGLSRFIDRGTKGIDFLLRYVFFMVLPTLIEVILVSLILWILYGFFYAIITFITISLYTFLTFSITQWRLKFRRTMNKADNSVSTKIVDSLLNYETVKYFNNENHEYKRLDFSLQNYEVAANKNRESLSILNITQTFVIMIGITIMLIMTAFGIKNGIMTIGGFVVVNAYMLQLYQPLNFLGTVYREIRQALIDMENMFDLLDEKSEIKNSKNIEIDNIYNPEIKFTNISFFYDSRRSIIKNISFKVPHSKKTAIVGPTGAGKSTISKLLFRFYDPTEGKITINNQNIKDLSQDILRRKIGVVPQDTVLFNDSIYYNIAYGDPNADEKEIIAAAKAANIHKLIVNLPDGYNTLVGERGLKLSGGEKQRVAIARVILKKPDIYFFDEATSALDSSTEKEIQKNLEELSKEKTTLIIAHRLSTVVSADNIIVLDMGKIVEEGPHEYLLNLQGKYFDMWEKQKQNSLIEI
jgi:ATP-binding cassette subfamily B protein